MVQLNNRQATKWDQSKYLILGKDYSLEYYKTVKARIYQIIWVHSMKYGGIAHNELSDIIKLDRKNVRKYVRNLIDEGLVARKEGLRGKYVVMDIDSNFLLLSDLLIERFKDFLFGSPDKFVILNNTKRTFYSNGNASSGEIDFSTYSKLYLARFGKQDFAEKALFEFSNLIGGFITYVTMQSINPDNLPQMDTDDQNELSDKFIENSLMNMLALLLQRFKDIVRFIIKSSKQIDPQKEEHFTIKKPDFLKLIKAYTRLYPLLSFSLEEVLPTKYVYGDFHDKNFNPVDSLKKYFKEIDEKTSKKNRKRDNKKVRTTFASHVMQ